MNAPRFFHTRRSVLPLLLKSHHSLPSSKYQAPSFTTFCAIRFGNPVVLSNHNTDLCAKWEYEQPANRSLNDFLVQVDFINKSCHVLQNKDWDHKVKTALRVLDVPWDNFIIVDVLKSFTKASVAWEFFKWVEDADGFDHDSCTYNSMLQLFGQSGDIEGIERVLCRMEQAGCMLDSVLVTTLLYWYDKFNCIHKAMELWKHLESMEFKPNATAYTAMLSLLANHKQYQDVSKLYAQMVANGIKPNQETYHVLINCLVCQGKLDVAFLICEQMPFLKVLPSFMTYKLLLTASILAGNVTMAKVVYQRLRNSGFVLTISLHQEIEKCLHEYGDQLLKEQWCFSSEHPEPAPIFDYVKEDALDNPTDYQAELGLSDEVGHKSVIYCGNDPDPFDISLLARVILAWGPDIEEAIAAYKIRWDCHKVSQMLGHIKHWSVAWSFFNWVRDQDGYKHNSFTYAKMASILTKYRKIEVLEKLLGQVYKADNTCHDVVVFNAFFSAYSRAVLKGRCMHLIYWMREQQIQPNSRTFACLIVFYCKVCHLHEKAMEVYTDMIGRGYLPDVHTYTVLIECLAHAGEMTKALGILHEMPKYGCYPNAVTYTVLIDACIKKDKIAEAMALYNKMQGRNIEPTAVTYSLLLKGLVLTGKSADANKVLKARNFSEYAKCGSPQSYFERVVQDLFLKNVVA